MTQEPTLVLRKLLLWTLLVGLLLHANGLRANGTASPDAMKASRKVPGDTVYVAEADPLAVVYYTQIDTLVVHPEGEVDAPIATAPSEETAPVDASRNVSGPDANTEARTASTSEVSPDEEGWARGANNPESRPSSADASSGVKQGISVAGLVIDRTHSVIGRDFQNVFHDHWEEPADASNFTIRIVERPLPQFGSQIRVSVGETTVFQAQLRPEYRRIEEAARQAAARARYYLNEFYEPREVY